jgi:hypothetical protein
MNVIKPGVEVIQSIRRVAFCLEYRVLFCALCPHVAAF